MKTVWLKMNILWKKINWFLLVVAGIFLTGNIIDKSWENESWKMEFLDSFENPSISSELQVCRQSVPSFQQPLEKEIWKEKQRGAHLVNQSEKKSTNINTGRVKYGFVAIKKAGGASKLPVLGTFSKKWHFLSLKMGKGGGRHRINYLLQYNSCM